MTRRVHAVVGVLLPLVVAAALTPSAHAEDPVITIDASFQPCPTGYVKIGHECVREETEPATYVCPSEWTLSGSSCSRTETQPATKVCAVGYVLQPDDSCQRIETQAANVSCPAGYTLQGDECRKPETQAAMPSCPSGYALEGDECRKTETVTAAASCPSGYTLQGSECRRVETEAATASCPSGYALQSGECRRTETQPASASCPSGYTLQSGQCSRTETQSAAASCPAGYALENGQCRRTETQAANAACPAGYTLQSGQCYRTETQAATAFCPAGYTLQGGQCLRTETQSATASCPSGYTLQNGQCSLADAYYPVCPEYTFDSGGTCICYFCNPPIDIGPPMACYPPYVLSGGLCRYTWTQAPSYACSAGWTLSGTTCSTTLSLAASYSCPSGWALSGTTCARTLSQAPSYSCASGWTLSGTSCTRTLTQVPAYSCASGWTLSGTTCSRTLTQTPSYSCASGWTLSGTNCARTLTQTPSYSCGAGWTLSGTSCSRTLTQTPAYSCAVGWTLSGTTCARTLTQAPAYSCASGWTLAGTSCARTLTQAPIYACASGWTLSGMSCTRVLTESSSWTCPSGGWTLAGSTCSQIRTQGAELMCADGWELNGSDCDRTLGADVVYFCPPAWTLHDVDSCRITFAGSLTKSLEIDEGLQRIIVTSFDTEIDMAQFELIAYRNGTDYALSLLESSIAAGETIRSYDYADLAAGFWSLRVDMRSNAGLEASYVHDAALYVPDVESPQIDIVTPQTGVIESFEQIVVTLSDNLDPAPEVLEIRLINEPEETEEILLNWGPTGFNVYAPNLPLNRAFVMPFTRYAVHVKAKDFSANEAAETVVVEYRPRQIDPVELYLPAVAKEFLRGDGKPALITPALTLSNGESISSERDIFATLAADADLPLVINGIAVAPGSTERVANAYNFLLTGGKMELSVHPGESGVVGTAALRLATDNPGTPVVDVAIETWTASARVTAESWQVLQGWGEAKFYAALDQGTRCILTTDREQAVFADNLSSPVCLLSWTQLPAGVEAYPPTSAAPGVARAQGYPHEAGAQAVAIDVGVFAADGSYETLFSTSATAEIESLFGQIAFAPTREIETLMLGVENFDLQLEQASGPACGATVDEEHARNDVAVGRKTCYIEWAHLPEAVTQWPGRTKPWLSGHLTRTSDSIDWRVKVFTPAGDPILANEQSIVLTAEYPSAPQLEFEADNEVGEGLAAIPLAGGRVGTLSIESANADLDILVERAGAAVLDEKVAAGFSNWGQGAGRLRQSRRINDEGAAALWETRPFTAKVGFSELPEVSTEIQWEGIYVPSYDIRPVFDPSTVSGTGVQNVLNTDGLHVSVYMAEGSNGPDAYDEATTGAWQIQLARMVRVDEYEPLTEPVRTENGIASFDVDLADIEESFLRIMPIAVLRSPDGRYERVVPAERPLVFVVVNGAELGAELEARRVSGPAPLTMIVNAALEDRLDYQAVGDVRWELRRTDVEVAEWQTIEHDARRPMNLRYTFERGFYDLRTTVKNKFSGAEFVTEPLTIAAYNVPDVTVAGPRNIFVGDPARFVVQGEEEGDEELIVEWSEDRGATWLSAGRQYTVRSEVAGRLDLWMRARFENTPEEDPLGYRTIRSRAAYRVIRGPGVRVAGPNRLELGATGTYTVRMREPYPNMDVVIRGAFILPDGTRVEAESIDYTATEIDFEAGKIDIEYEAWIEGYESAGAVNHARQRVAVWQYAWPEWDLIASRGSRFAPSAFTLELRPRDFRGSLENPEYTFDISEGVEVLNAGPTSRHVRINTPGEYLFQAHVTDARGHAASAELRHEVLEAPELLVSFTHRPGNAYYRAPLDLILRPKVQGGHPKDRAVDFRYFLDGQPFEDESRFPVITLDPGSYTVELEVETQMGQVERAGERFTVFPNQPPTCELEQWETSLGWRFNANCSDADGRIVDFLWTLDGEEITQRGSRMSVSRLGRNGPPAVTVQAVDDAGEPSEVQRAR